MSELQDLYQEVILDHGKRPRNFEVPSAYDRMARGHNPLCGDKLAVYADLDGDTIRRLTFHGSGCAISVASASMMTEALAGKTEEEAEVMFQAFHDLVTGKAEPGTVQDRLAKLIVFAGVKDFPVRVKCASLAWHTMRAALESRDAPVTTE